VSATAAALALPPAPRRAALLGLGSPLQVGTAVVLLTAACVVALQVNSYYVFVLANVALLAIAGIGLNVLLGLTGQVSLSHVGFYAIGAYGRPAHHPPAPPSGSPGCWPHCSPAPSAACSRCRARAPAGPTWR
jgi:hypothetical protein